MLLHTRSRLLLVAGALAFSLLTACNEKKAADTAAPAPIEVGVVQVNTSDVPLVVELPGRTTAYRKAEVRPQVSGIIERRLFTEGADIKAGTQLYQIDQASYQSVYATAQAELARADANLLAATAREQRYKNLVATNGVSRQDYDDTLASFSQAKAGVAAAKAAMETAHIQLQRTRVNAPIDGVIGISSVTEGALVSAGQAQVLVTIQQLDPIYVDVSQSVEQLLQLRRQMMQGNVTIADSVKVKLLLNDGTFYEHQGSLQFSEVDVNETTGTVTLRALFPNPDRLLLPGMFVRTQVEEGVRTNSILVSQRGITRDRSGNATALVVNTKGIIELRQLKTGRAVGDQWLVLDGLAVGEQVIVEGLQKAKPGMPARAVLTQVSTSSAGE